jgi:hypothetical protein
MLAPLAPESAMVKFFVPVNGVLLLTGMLIVLLAVSPFAQLSVPLLLV